MNQSEFLAAYELTDGPWLLSESGMIRCRSKDPLGGIAHCPIVAVAERMGIRHVTVHLDGVRLGMDSALRRAVLYASDNWPDADQGLRAALLARCEPLAIVE